MRNDPSISFSPVATPGPAADGPAGRAIPPRPGRASSSIRRLAIAPLIVALAASIPRRASADVDTITTLASFNGAGTGQYPGAVVVDSRGNVYGTTETGGANSNGTLYVIPAGTQSLTTLVNFSYNTTGSYATGLTSDSQGNLYGSTTYGGSTGYGTVFEVSAANHALSTIGNLNYSTTGAYPVGTVLVDPAGDVYGTTQYGGANNAGTVYEIAAGTHALTTIANLSSSTTGSSANGGMVMDSGGNLYGTTYNGGPGGAGTVFEVAAGTHALTTIASFSSNGSLGANPYGGLAIDSAGNLYGTMIAGGAGGVGTVFEIAAGTHALTTLATFNGVNGEAPSGDMLVDPLGNLFGTTGEGGVDGDGTVFEIAAGTHALTTLATFNGTDGSGPGGGLAFDARGDLYGTTSGGGAGGVGTVFELTPAAVPGPVSLLTLAQGGGLVGLGLVARARRRGHLIRAESRFDAPAIVAGRRFDHTESRP